MTPMTSWTDPQTPITYQPTIPQRPRTPGWVWPVIAIAAVVGIVIGAGVTLLVSHGSGLGSTSTFTASGTLTLEDASFLDQVGTECTGSDGYDDIAAGAQVVIYDSTNKILKVGALSDGSLSTTGAGFCVFTFSVPGIKSGVGPYSVQVSHRGEISFNQSEAGNLSLSLGSGG
jgi:hypothetical protein